MEGKIQNMILIMYHWAREEDDMFHVFPVTAWLAIHGVLLQHWNCNVLSKLIVHFAHVISVEEETLSKEDLSAMKVRAGCEKLEAIPLIHCVFGKQICKISIKVEASLGGKAYSEAREEKLTSGLVSSGPGRDKEKSVVAEAAGARIQHVNVQKMDNRFGNGQLVGTAIIGPIPVPYHFSWHRYHKTPQKPQVVTSSERSKQRKAISPIR